MHIDKVRVLSHHGNVFAVQHNDIHDFLGNLAAAGDETDTVTCIVTMLPLISASLQ